MSLRKRKPMRPYVSGLPKQRERRPRKRRVVVEPQTFAPYQGPDVAVDGSYEADSSLWPCPDGAFCRECAA